MSTKQSAGQSAIATVSSILSDDMFVSGDVIEHPVKLGDGTERVLYFRQLSAVEIKQHFTAERSTDQKVANESTARLIAKALVEPDGRRALTPARAAQLKPAVSGAIYWAILELNGVLPGKAENKPEDDSGEDDDGETIGGEDD